MWPNPQETADLVTFTEEILNEKLHFCAVHLKEFTLMFHDIDFSSVVFLKSLERKGKTLLLLLPELTFQKNFFFRKSPSKLGVTEVRNPLICKSDLKAYTFS